MEQLADPLWRLENLYHIKRASDGKVIPFEPRPEQRHIYRLLLKAGKRRIIILKARRLGMSTAIDLLLADQTLWNAGLQASIVDQTSADAERKLETIVKTALDNLPEVLRERFTLTKDSDTILEISAGDTPSAIFAGLRARGGTNNWLHLSEWGVIQADDPRRSEEILTGALPSAEHGTIVVETTWKGGRGGHLWTLVKRAMETPASEQTPKDWHVVFFPWWKDPTYTIEGDIASVAKETTKYLDAKQAETGHTFSPGQRIWYDRQQRDLGMFVFREFPTTVDECFRSPVEGAIYADILDTLRAAGKINAHPIDNSALVHTVWDLGSPQNTVTWYFQLIAGEIRVIDCDTDLDLTPVQRAAHILGKGYPLGHHYLPHDAAATAATGRTFEGELQSAGLRATRVLPRTRDIWIGINRLRQLLPRFTFRLPHCEHGLDALAAYHYKRTSSTGITVEEPVHDWASHPSDALRMLAEAEMAGALAPVASRPRQTARVLTGIRG